MALPPNDPWIGHRSELPDIRGPRGPVGYRRGFEWGTRLQGLLLLVIGLVGITGVYLVFRAGGVPGAPAPPPPPPGLRGLSVPSLVNVASCFGLLITLGSLGLILVGLRRIVDPY
jgi:hypothetical protein